MATHDRVAVARGDAKLNQLMPLLDRPEEEPAA
jgi:hypothetical protein